MTRAAKEQAHAYTRAPSPSRSHCLRTAPTPPLPVSSLSLCPPLSLSQTHHIHIVHWISKASGVAAKRQEGENSGRLAPWHRYNYISGDLCVLACFLFSTPRECINTVRNSCSLTAQICLPALCNAFSHSKGESCWHTHTHTHTHAHTHTHTPGRVGGAGVDNLV
jgi:hypothetical protein